MQIFEQRGRTAKCVTHVVSFVRFLVFVVLIEFVKRSVSVPFSCPRDGGGGVCVRHRGGSASFRSIGL